MKQQDISDGRLRISVMGSGCSGYAYDMVFDEKEVEGKHVIAAHNDFVDDTKDVLFNNFGVSFISDKNSLSLMRGTVVDYVETSQDSGFKFNNPRALPHK